jgi:serine/threonine-protein kinase
MATVYHAYDPRFKREVALKVLPRQFLHDPTFRARFEREAQTVAGLEHPAIVPVYDFGEEDGQLYLVMRYLPGGSLTDRLKQGPLPYEETVRIITILAAALDEAHRQGIIHRDLKPDNILFDQRDDPYLTDFGIAKLSTGSGQITTGGLIVGTPAYMSPEQASDEEIDHRSDIYALGIITFQTLTGQLPFQATTPVVLLMKHMTEPVPRIRAFNPKLPVGYDTVLTKALAKNRDDRYATALDLAVALAEASFTKSIHPFETQVLEIGPFLTQPPANKPTRLSESSIVCPKCRHSNSPQVTACANCGYRLRLACLMCHTINPLEATHCTNCGADLKRTQLRRQGVDEARRRALAERDGAYREKEARQLRDKVQILLKQLRYSSKRTDALYQLDQLDDKKLTMLTDNLQQDRDPEQRRLTATVLEQLCYLSQIDTALKSQITQAFIDALEDPDPDVRQQIELTLQKIGKKQQGEVLAIFRGLVGWLKGG